MSIIANNLLQGDEGYNISRSLRFRSSASAYLNRTPASAGNQQKWTWSGWVKRSNIGSTGALFGGGTSGSAYAEIYFSNEAFSFYNEATATEVKTAAVYRDPSAWYHLIVATDTTQATSSNRVKLYVNGSQITSFAGTTNYPSQNANLYINSANIHSIGSLYYTASNTDYLDGYLTEINFVDGQQLTASSFGETDVLTGVWKPKKYGGTYGTNGFYLPFTDVATTSGSNAGLGKDFSGNGNYWTTNNISVTAGTTYDSMVDVPTISALASNYCTLNPLPKPTNTLVFSNGNLNLTVGTPPSSSSNGSASGTMAVSSGKWYWEVTAGDNFNGGSANYTDIGIGNLSTINLTGDPHVAGAYMYYANGSSANGYYWDGSSFTSYGVPYKAGNIIGVALDLDNNQITWYVNNSSQGTKTITANTYVPRVGGAIDVGNIVANFGQRPFSYTPPTGFVALNTFNLPEPSIKAGNKYMDATTYTGNGSSQSIVNTAGFQPDFVWVKRRNGASDHYLSNSIGGANKNLYSNRTNAEVTNNSGGYISSFNANGFTPITGSTNANETNSNNDTYVGWQWKANGAGSSNTAGSITSTVSANPTAGFSVVTYTGNATAGSTVGHGLGATPAMIIVKKRSGTQEWGVYHQSLAANEILQLNLTNSVYANSQVFNDQRPTSSVFYLGGNIGISNSSGATYVAYCFAEVAGYSKFGSYTGNGSADGAFVYLGFQPKWLMIKVTNTTDNWYVIDTSRQTYNVFGSELIPNSSSAEVSFTLGDIVSNGFKIRNSGSVMNGNGNTVIYAAFAENPFKYSLAR